MESVICPNCGSKISIPDSMPDDVICEKCQSKFGVMYEAIEPLTFKEKIWKFTHDHRKKIAAGLIIGAIAYQGYLWYQRLMERNSSEETPILSDSTISENDSSEDTASTEMELDNDPDTYDRKTVMHNISIRNMGENRYPSPEKRQQAKDLGIDLGPHQTLVDEYPQRHRVKKEDS